MRLHHSATSNRTMRSRLRSYLLPLLVAYTAGSCSFTVGSDYGDPEMAKLSGSTQDECCEACSNAPGECKVAVFDTTTGDCSMKTSANQPRQTQKFVACAPQQETPHTVRSPTTHYGDPFQGACLPDEQNITLPGPRGGAVCSTPVPVDGNVSCPVDVPAGCTSKPSALIYGWGKSVYCVLPCAPSAAAGDACGLQHATCKEIATGQGVCTYDA